MNSHEIEDIISESIGNQSQSDNGWDFSERLVKPPRVIEVKDPNGSIWKVWLVLDETGNGSGYRIVLDPSDRSYNLVTGGIMVSEYATILEAINGL